MRRHAVVLRERARSAGEAGQARHRAGQRHQWRNHQRRRNDDDDVHDDDDNDDEGANDDKDGDDVNNDDDDEPTKLDAWGHTMGALYEKLTTYSAFAVGGEEYYSSHSYDGTITTAQLQVVQDGAVVKAWALNAPLPVDELLPFCTTAGFGDLKTQTTVIDASVRTAMELPSAAYAKLHGGATATPAGVTFRIVDVELARDGSRKKVLDGGKATSSCAPTLPWCHTS